MSSFKHITIIALSFFICACSSVRVKTDFDPNADFSQIKRFSFHQSDSEKTTSLIDGRIESAISKLLTARSFSKADEESADILVRYDFGIDKRLNIDQFFAVPFQRRPFSVAYQFQARETDVDTLVIDLIDRKKDRVIWQGVASGRIRSSGSPDEQEQRVMNVVEEIFKSFPPSK